MVRKIFPYWCFKVNEIYQINSEDRFFDLVLITAHKQQQRDCESEWLHIAQWQTKLKLLSMLDDLSDETGCNCECICMCVVCVNKFSKYFVNILKNG